MGLENASEALGRAEEEAEPLEEILTRDVKFVDSTDFIIFLSIFCCDRFSLRLTDRCCFALPISEADLVFLSFSSLSNKGAMSKLSKDISATSSTVGRDRVLQTGGIAKIGVCDSGVCCETGMLVLTTSFSGSY